MKAKKRQSTKNNLAFFLAFINAMLPLADRFGKIKERD